MSADRPVFEKFGRRVGLAGTSALALVQVACAKAEPIVQAPAPPQAAATETVPPIPASPLNEEKETQIEECRESDFRGPITMKGSDGQETTFKRFRAPNERHLRSGPALDAPVVAKVPPNTLLEIECMRLRIQGDKSFVSSLFKSPNIIGWGEPGEPGLENIMLRAIRAKPLEPPLTPFTIETPFPRYGVYAGPMFVETPSPRNNRGYMAMMTPLDSVVGGVFSYVRDIMKDTECFDKSSSRSWGSIKIEPKSFINQGFVQRGRLGESVEGFMPDPNTVVGRVTFPPYPGQEKCGEEKFSYATRAKGNGPDDFLGAYMGLFQQAEMRTDLTTAEALAEIERDIGGVKLPPKESK